MLSDLMRAFPGRFPNEVLRDLDVSLLARVNAARRIEEIEARRQQWLTLGGDLTTEEWEAIREHDELVRDYTVKVIEA